jgi:hypothetical protein
MELIFTTVGLDEIATLIAAGDPVQITEIALGTGVWIADENATALMTELKRLTLTGDKTADATIHITATDASTDEYTIYEAGIYLSSGTLLAIAADGDPITGKAIRTTGFISADLPLLAFADANVVIGGTGFMLPQSTESVAGISKQATVEEAQEGTIDNKTVTPAGVKAAFDNRTATTETTGLVELATPDEALDESEAQKVITPAALSHVLSQPTWHWTGAREIGTPFQIKNESNVAVGFILQMSVMSETAFVTVGGSIQRFEFNGTAWVKVGTGFSYPSNDNPVITALSDTDIAVIRSDADVLNTLRWNGTAWIEVGNALPISAVLSHKSIVALSTNTVAIVNDNRNDLGFYEFDGTDWAQVGNRLPLSFSGQNVYRSRITALTSNRIAFASSNDVLVAYEFDGTDWAQVGNVKNIPDNYWCGVAALNSTDVVVVNNASDDLRVYRFNGTDWIQKGRPTTINVGDVSQSIALLAISGNEVLVFLSEDDMVHHYVIDYAPSRPPSPALGTM